MEKEPDQELSDEQLDQVVGGVAPNWAQLGKTDCEHPHGGCHWHGKPNGEDLFEGTTDSGL